MGVIGDQLDEPGLRLPAPLAAPPPGVRLPFELMPFELMRVHGDLAHVCKAEAIVLLRGGNQCVVGRRLGTAVDDQRKRDSGPT